MDTADRPEAERQAPERHVVGILVGDEESMPPGLETVADMADVRLVRGDVGLVETLREAEVLCVWDFRRQRLEQAWPEAQKLRWVHAASAGVDAVNIPPLVESDVVVTNTRGVLDDAIAEWVLAVMLLFVKDLDGTLRLQRRHDWQHRNTERLAGRRVLVVGAGSVGRAVAALCRAAGMRVDGVARTSRPPDGDFESVVGADGLAEALSGAEFVVLCVPLTVETHGMIGAAELAALPHGARLVNVSRGPVVDEAALLDALRTGRLGGAALDVFEQEPLPPEHPFWEMPQVIVSPHMAGDFVGWEEAFSEVFLENFRRWQRGEPLANVVDKGQLMAPVSRP
jgi:phosphoglycerate dehydrogenase-like enzyme